MEKLCDRCTVPGCCLNYLGKACANARKETCPDIVPNNAETIGNLNKYAFAVFLANWASCARGNALPCETDPESILAWLDQDYDSRQPPFTC